jgi:hypothetical protein
MIRVPGFGGYDRQSPLQQAMLTDAENHDAAGLLAKSRELVDHAERAGVPLRLLGGVGIALHCPRILGGHPHRSFADVDAVTSPQMARRLASVVIELGYEPNTRFNAMHGDRRMMFTGPSGKLDVFVGRFEMCHRVDLSGRLGLEQQTLPATDLLITKLQIVELNEKDAVDAALLLREHSLGEGDGDHIDVLRLHEVVRDDWGLWRTMTKTLTALGDRVTGVAGRSSEVARVLDQAPKGRAFRMRARIGEHKRWYELPEDVA